VLLRPVANVAVATVLTLLLAGCDTVSPRPGATPEPRGDTLRVYVPVYSFVYHLDAREALNLTTTVSVRNTDPDRSVALTEVRYFDSQGRTIRDYIDEPRTLEPLASAEFVVEEYDVGGGSGANFLVDVVPDGATEPLVEAVMVSTRPAFALAFTSRGVVTSRR
jgi:hypothetical protein